MVKQAGPLIVKIIFRRKLPMRDGKPSLVHREG